MTLVYRLIIAILIFFITLDMFEEKSFKNQLNCVFVLVPLILRVLMIK